MRIDIATYIFVKFSLYMSTLQYDAYIIVTTLINKSTIAKHSYGVNTFNNAIG